MPEASSTHASPPPAAADSTGGAASSIAVTDPARALAWAVFLGISWTWVIGMFLPVLLIRDFGPAAWFIFAIPNVVGAAAMGWAIRSGDHSLRFVVQHREATTSFSLVTIAFHLFFLLWVVPKLIGDLAASIAFGIALVGMVPLLMTTLSQPVRAMLVLVASLVIFMIAAGRGSLGWPDVASGGAFELIALMAVCTLGFVTCPYLDLTFHRARQACRTEEESKLAFGVGFGVVFLSMIVFTLLYAGVLIHGRTDGQLGALLGTHIAMQAIFTVGVHASALRGTVSTPREDARANWSLWTAVGFAIVAALASRAMERRGVHVGNLLAGEVVYRTFMSFYGLIAPAYVWLCAHPGRGFLSPHRRELQMFAIAVVAAAPFYWIAFMHGSMHWVLVGVGIVIGARFLLDYTRRDYLAEQRAMMLAQADAASARRR